MRRTDIDADVGATVSSAEMTQEEMIEHYELVPECQQELVSVVTFDDSKPSLAIITHLVMMDATSAGGNTPLEDLFAKVFEAGRQSGQNNPF